MKIVYNKIYHKIYREKVDRLHRKDLIKTKFYWYCKNLSNLYFIFL